MGNYFFPTVLKIFLGFRENCAMQVSTFLAGMLLKKVWVKFKFSPPWTLSLVKFQIPQGEFYFPILLS